MVAGCRVEEEDYKGIRWDEPRLALWFGSFHEWRVRSTPHTLDLCGLKVKMFVFEETL